MGVWYVCDVCVARVRCVCVRCVCGTCAMCVCAMCVWYVCDVCCVCGVCVCGVCCVCYLDLIYDLFFFQFENSPRSLSRLLQFHLNLVGNHVDVVPFSGINHCPQELLTEQTTASHDRLRDFTFGLSVVEKNLSHEFFQLTPLHLLARESSVSHKDIMWSW